MRSERKSSRLGESMEDGIEIERKKKGGDLDLKQ
jgi:hypothetical protein